MVPEFLFYYSVGFAFRCLLEEHDALSAWFGSKNIGLLFVLSLAGYGLSVLMYGIVSVNLLVTMLGILGTLFLAMAASGCDFLRYVGRRTLTVMVTHGPVYRVVLVVISVIIGSSTEVIRGDFFIVLVTMCITLLLCLGVDEVVARIVSLTTRI